MNTGYILAAWIVVLGGLALYAAATIARGRRLARRVPPDRRRWIDTEVEGTGVDGVRRELLGDTSKARDAGASGGERGA